MPNDPIITTPAPAGAPDAVQVQAPPQDAEKVKTLEAKLTEMEAKLAAAAVREAALNAGTPPKPPEAVVPPPTPKVKTVAEAKSDAVKDGVPEDILRKAENLREVEMLTEQYKLLTKKSTPAVNLDTNSGSSTGATDQELVNKAAQGLVLSPSDMLRVQKAIANGVYPEPRKK